MTRDEFYTFLCTWIQDKTGITTIRTNENGPRPSIPYIAIQNPPISDMETGEGNYSDPDGAGVVNYAIGYELNTNIIEVGAEGQHLQLLLSKKNNQEELDHFKSNNVSMLTNGIITGIPAATDTTYIEKRNMLNATFIYIYTNGAA